MAGLCCCGRGLAQQRRHTRSRRSQPIARAEGHSATTELSPQELLAATCVIDDGAAKQGTAFALEGGGMVTCALVLSDASFAYRPEMPSRHFPIRVIRRRPLTSPFLSARLRCAALPRGAANGLPMLAHLALVGYPIYQIGDSGVLRPGLVVGFRPVSGVRRILTDAGIVGGMSGGPAVDGDGGVVGVCVTGADRFDRVDETEAHALIPIDALDLLCCIERAPTALTWGSIPDHVGGRRRALPRGRWLHDACVP